MESFYGGRPGRDFRIIQRFTDLALLLEDLTPEHSSISLDSYVILDLENNSELLHKTYENINAKYYNENSKLGYDLIANLKGAVGPEGTSPEVTIIPITDGNQIIITDKEHPSGQTFNVYNGKRTIQSVTVVLNSSAWNNQHYQTVTVNGIVENENQQVIEVAPTSASRVAYNTAGIEAISQGNNSLTFYCKTIPNEDLSVNVAISELSSSEEQGTSVLLSSVTLIAENWVGEESYTQTVTISGATSRSKIDLQPSKEQLDKLKNTVLVIENNNGTFIAHASGEVPTEDMTIQCTITNI